MNEQDGGCWIDEPTRKEIVDLLKVAKSNIPANGGGKHGDTGRINDVLAKLEQKRK